MTLFPPHLCDFYKTGHIVQYPAGTTEVYSNFTARSSTHFPIPKEDFDGKVVFVGLQGIIQWFLIDLWNQKFFAKDLNYVMSRYSSRMGSSLGPGMDSTHIKQLWELGYLPIEIMALKEGTKVPLKVPMYTIRNTLPDFAWLTNYLESALSAESWKPITTATIAHQYRKVVDKYQEETGGPAWFSDFQCHDFSMRGMSGVHDAAQSGIGHLVSFKGTDTIPAIDYIYEYYGSTDLVGASVPASEHSVMSAGGKETEIETYRRLITKIYPAGIVSIVSDTWDFFNVINGLAVELKPEIMAREGKVVFRPDSGDPVEIICGADIPDYSLNIKGEEASFEEAKRSAYGDALYGTQDETPHGEHGEDYPTAVFKYKSTYYKVTVEIDWNRHDKQFYYIDGSRIQSCHPIPATPEMLGAVEVLWNNFGGTVNTKGFKELDSHVGLIYGDSITYARAKEILQRLKKKGFASCNIVFGVGSYTYQHITRDSLGMAMKSTNVEINGVSTEIFKDPKTDSGTKKSAKGYLKVIRDDDGELVLVDQVYKEDIYLGEMEVVFRDGELLVDQTFDEVRATLKSCI